MSADAYLQARDEFTEVDKRLKAVAAQLTTVAQHLETSPGMFLFANAPAELPIEVVGNPRHASFDAHQWPTPAQINALLAEWHQKHTKMRSAWTAMPESQRSAFKPPFLMPGRGY